MAGLGTRVGTSFSLRTQMSGFPVLAGEGVSVWVFTHDEPNSSDTGFMGDRAFPSVHIEPIEGQLTTLQFFNNAGNEHTIHLHGLDVDQANDGVPQTSFEVPKGGRATYEFVAPHAGTYHYHCHVDTVIHYAKGMHGAVIVRPPDGSTNRAWDGGPTFDEEVLWQLHTVDPVWNNTALGSGPSAARFHPKAFLLNGLETANALTDSYSEVVVARGQKAYIRLINASYHWARVSLGGLMFDVVATDGRPVPTPATVGTWELGPGERYDLLLTAANPGEFVAQIDYLDDYSSAVLGSVQTRVRVI